MNPTRVRTLALVGALAFAPAFAAPTPAAMLAPFEAKYRVMRDGMHIADATFTLARDGEDGWSFASVTRPVGFLALLRSDEIHERSDFRLGAERPIPLHSHYEHRGSSKDRDAHYTFDWQREKVTGTFRGKPVDLALARGTLDGLTLRLAVGLDLARGALAEVYPVVERRTTREYRLTALPAQRVRVAAGEFEVLGAARTSEDGTKTTRFLYAAQLNWAPVLMDQSETDEPTYRLELVSFTRK